MTTGISHDGMTRTVHVAIGNSDDKLTQAEWSAFVHDFRSAMSDLAMSICGVWYSAPDQPFQNCCIAVAIKEQAVLRLLSRLAGLREKYNQDSIAVNVSDTEFV